MVAKVEAARSTLAIARASRFQQVDTARDERRFSLQ
jgi:hypothetical protein